MEEHTNLDEVEEEVETGHTETEEQEMENNDTQEIEEIEELELESQPVNKRKVRVPNKVGFLSSRPRGYYPEDPGFSRFGITYRLPDPFKSPKCNFVPSSNLLQKPISRLGYSIGGLSAPRFAKLVGSDNPAPNMYQSSLIPPVVKAQVKMKKAKWGEFVEKFERIVQEQYGQYMAEKEAEEIRARQEIKRGARLKSMRMSVPKAPEPEPVAIMTVAPVIRPKPVFCPRKLAAFGRCLTTPRFPPLELNTTAGVGTYSLTTSDPKLKKSFQITTPEGVLVPRVRIVCSPGVYDTCMSCSQELSYSDYYQTKRKLQLRVSDPHADTKVKMVYLSMCKACYCEASRHGFEPWTRTQVPLIFMKARHCNAVHDHQEGHSEYLKKATCKAILNLARKELVYSRYFKDNPCHKAI